MYQAAVTQRPWVTAGVALTAASMVAVAPLAGPTLPEISFPDIQLTGLVEDTAGNITNLVDYFAGAPVLAHAAGTFLGDPAAIFLGPNAAPLPVLQQVIQNQLGYLGQVFNNPGDIGTVFESMFGNLQAGLLAPFGDFADNITTGGGLALNDVGFLSTEQLFGVIQTMVGGGDLAGLIDFTASPASGLLLGAVGPVLGPLVALGNGLGDVFGGDVGALLGIPGDMLGAFLNGGETLSILPLLDLIGMDPNIDIPGIGSIGLTEVGLKLGGILGGPGSLINALTVTGGIPNVLDVGIFGEGAGPLGSLISIPNSIAGAIDNPGVWDGLLPTLATGLGLDPLAAGLNDIGAFLTTDVLGPLKDVLMGVPIGLSDLFEGLLGSDLGIQALAQMMVDVPQLLLAMML